MRCGGEAAPGLSAARKMGRTKVITERPASLQRTSSASSSHLCSWADPGPPWSWTKLPLVPHRPGFIRRFRALQHSLLWKGRALLAPHLS